MEDIQIGENRFVSISCEERSTLAFTCDKPNLFKSDDVTANFIDALCAAFGRLTPIHVSGSYVPWCLLGRPAWTIGDLDVYLTHEAPGIYSAFVTWMRDAYPGVELVPHNHGILEFVLPGAAQKISLVFHRVQDAVRQFDMSMLRVFVEADNLCGSYRSNFSAIHYQDVVDLANMRGRTHPLLLEQPSAAREDMPASFAELFKPENQKLRDKVYAHVAKYVGRGFTIAAEEYPAKAAAFISSVNWYRVFENGESPASRFKNAAHDEPWIRAIGLLARRNTAKRLRSE